MTELFSITHTSAAYNDLQETTFYHSEAYYFITLLNLTGFPPYSKNIFVLLSESHGSTVGIVTGYKLDN
jgi:hypothetical protein